jgi:gliding motility-associated-like protein
MYMLRILIIIFCFSIANHLQAKDKVKITGQQPLSSKPGQSITIQLSDLTVDDPDHEYPNGFTLKLSDGDHYEFVDQTVFPNPGFTGTLYVPVHVQNKKDKSEKYDLVIEVVANDNVPPVITGQSSLSINENTSIDISLTNLTVYDPDNIYPDDFTLQVLSGSNYTLQGNTVIPSQNFSGILNVPVIVNDGQASSDPFNLQITVNEVQQNTPPVITGQAALSTNESTAITIQLNDLTVSDPDNVYPNGFSLNIFGGSNYSVSGATVTPDNGFVGNLSVPVQVNDGTDNSGLFNLQITVQAVHHNTPPVITGQSNLSTNESTPITIQLSHLTVSDPDDSYPGGFTLIVFGGSNYSVDGSTITPAQGFSGTLSVPVQVNDGEDNSNLFNLQITVQAVHHNTPPVITGQTPLSTNENNSITIQLSHLTVSDPDDTYPSGFTLSVFSGSNYTVAGTTVTPAQGFSGTLTVPVQVNDGEDNSNTFNVQISVQHVNTAPVITGQTTLTTRENVAITIQLQHLTVSDPDDSYPSGFTLKVSTGQNYSLNGATITPTPGFFGTLTVPVQVNDGENDSPVFNLNISVTAYDEAPVITGQVPLTVTENEVLPIQFSNLTVSDPDNNYPAGFTLTIYPGSNYTSSGTVITPTLNFTGVLSVKVTVSDGVKESAPFGLKVTVVPGVNQEPVITGQVGLSTFKNQAIPISLSYLVVNDPDNVYPKDFKLQVLPGNNYTVTSNTVKPNTDFVGILSVGVTVNDGTSTSKPFNLSINVIEKKDLKIVGQKALSMLEDSTLTLKLSDLVVNDPENKYPAGFSLKILTNEYFRTSGDTIIPVKDFNGNLVLAVQVTSATRTSTPFSLLIVVQPVNDPPVINALESEALTYSINSNPTPLTRQAIVTDVDDENLIIAEVGFESGYQKGNDELIFNNTDNVHGIFDPESGLLTFVGEAPLAEYQQLIRGIEYNFANPNDTIPFENHKIVYFKLNDGKTFSSIYKRHISIIANVKVDIPNGFTPNDDNVNDTWQIEALAESASFRSAMVRVYTKTGLLVFQSDGFEKAWDGKLNGEFLPADSYFYTIDIDLSYTRKNLKGIVTILR